jgi:hypothetical protein
MLLTSRITRHYIPEYIVVTTIETANNVRWLLSNGPNKQRFIDLFTSELTLIGLSIKDEFGDFRPVWIYLTFVFIQCQFTESNGRNMTPRNKHLIYNTFILMFMLFGICK